MGEWNLIGEVPACNPAALQAAEETGDAGAWDSAAVGLVMSVMPVMHAPPCRPCLRG